jgi:hypothetical protein
MKKQELPRALQTEIRRHTFDTLVDQPPSVAQGGNGVVTQDARPAGSGCSRWRILWTILLMMCCRV